MTGGSEKALIDRRHAPGDDLYLGPGQTFVMLIVKFKNAAQLGVLKPFELDVGAQFIGNQAKARRI
jgi:hypothetical protein